MVRHFRFIFTFSFLLLSLTHCFGQTDSTITEEKERTERIKQFHADILVKENGNIVVTETITVYAAQQEIDHGIFRQLPMKNYSSKVSRNNFYTVLDVTKDWIKEPYHIDVDGENFKIYIGDKDISLSEGTYTYKLIYEVEAQIHSYDNFDEVYWNVTGNYWQFDIENVSAKVILPSGTSALQTHCYTGVLGSKESDCNSKIGGNSVYFTSKNLKKEEGFTVAVGFPKGIIHQPFFLPHYKIEEFLSAQKLLLAFLAVSICLLFYYFSWKRYGEDPLVSNESNQFIDIKKRYTPTSLQYIKERYSDSKTLLVAIISLSIKGAIEITGNGFQTWRDEFEYYLVKGSKTTNVPQEENAVLDVLFKESDTFAINSKSYTTFSQAETVLEKSLKNQHNLKDYFLSNLKQILIGTLITIAAIAGYTYLTAGTALIFVIVGFTTLNLTAILIIVIIRSFMKRQPAVAIPCIVIAIFTAVFTYASFFAINVDKNYSALNALVIFLILTGFAVFLSLINSYTQLGIITKVQIEKFKQQLLNYPVEQSTNIIGAYEENLPYAFALGIEEEWNLKFADALKSLNYTSNWIKTSDGSVGFSYQNITHFYDSYTSSSSSSSSGSSGGGSSGGGGGGGGGGGW
ncbi:DUF2207 domain-containing protein [Flavobacterium pectinovorum]|uniref:DUF2207 domain-containing protein n=1 Tax=Flavobacterium pectinovorum TaxID=29533 RepID=A0A502EH41_9FLAO|nr:DUF2207 domain-containing protein [Flavobacterium pectinovorum]TPG36369.1 DUF2207 domain-containing protein [Flavobacterium pectinovorum]